MRLANASVSWGVSEATGRQPAPARMLAELTTCGYDGWPVVEQDRVIAATASIEAPREDAARSCAYLQDVLETGR